MRKRLRKTARQFDALLPLPLQESSATTKATWPQSAIRLRQGSSSHHNPPRACRRVKSQWTRAGSLYAEIYRLGLSLRERDVYCYTIAHCTNIWPLSIELMAKILNAHPDTIRAALRVLVARHLLEFHEAPIGNPHKYQVSLLTRAGWGMPLPKGRGVPSADGRGVPSEDGEGCPSARALPSAPSNNPVHRSDAHLLSIGIKAVCKWHFSGAPIGPRHHINREQKKLIIEMMNGLVNEGLNMQVTMDAGLALIGEYLSFPQDPLDSKFDRREKTLSKFLRVWPDQWQRAKVYHASAGRGNIVPMSYGAGGKES